MPKYEGLLNSKGDTEMFSDFMEKNLKKHFDVEYKGHRSIDGVDTAFAADGTPYKSYAIQIPSVNTYMYMYESLNSAIDIIERVVDGLIIAKSHERPEGGSMAIRDVCLHWRRYPVVEVDNDFSNPTTRLNFRLHISHK